MSSPTLLSHTINDWLKVIERSKSARTLITYTTASNAFKRSIGKDIHISSLSENHYGGMLEYLRTRSSPQTEKLYATIIALYYEYLSAKGLHKVNMDTIRFMRRNETRKSPRRLRKLDMPALAEIDAKIMSVKPGKSLILARAKALTVTLARTGLRALEALSLKMNAFYDKEKMIGKVIGKGDAEGLFRFDEDVITAINEYRRLHKVNTEWVFISHSKRHSKKPKPIDYDTALLDIDLICSTILENDPEFKITPHQFRHYLVNEVYIQSGDLKQAQDAARHASPGTTTRYIHSTEESLIRINERRKVKKR